MKKTKESRKMEKWNLRKNSCSTQWNWFGKNWKHFRKREFIKRPLLFARGNNFLFGCRQPATRYKRAEKNSPRLEQENDVGRRCKSNGGLFHPFHIYRDWLDINITLADRWPRCTILLVPASAWPGSGIVLNDVTSNRGCHPLSIFVAATTSLIAVRHYANIMRRWNGTVLINYWYRRGQRDFNKKRRTN